MQRLPSSDDWVLGPTIVRLGRAADPFGHVVRVARPHLAALTEDTGESATLTANSTPTMVEVVAQVDTTRLVGMTNWSAAASRSTRPPPASWPSQRCPPRRSTRTSRSRR